MGELELQIDVVRYIKANEAKYPALALWYHVPNGGYRPGRVAIEMVNSGVRRGVPDLMHPGLNMGAIRGYAIELKFKAGKLSPDQEFWRLKLIDLGYDYLCSNDPIEVKTWIKDRFFN